MEKDARKGDEGYPFGRRAVPLNPVLCGPADGGEMGYNRDCKRPEGGSLGVEFTRLRGADDVGVVEIPFACGGGGDWGVTLYATLEEESSSS